MPRALITELQREVLGTRRQWGSTDSQRGAAVIYRYTKYPSCITTSLLKVERAKGWKKGGKTEHGINLRDTVIFELLLPLTAQGSSFIHRQISGSGQCFRWASHQNSSHPTSPMGLSAEKPLSVTFVSLLGSQGSPKGCISFEGTLQSTGCANGGMGAAGS